MHTMHTMYILCRVLAPLNAHDVEILTQDAWCSTDVVVGIHGAEYHVHSTH